MRSPTDYSPQECGWALIDGHYQYYWFDGPESPTISEIIGNLLIFYKKIKFSVQYNTISSFFAETEDNSDEENGSDCSLSGDESDEDSSSDKD